MKKFLVIFSILFMFFATTCVQVLADARWDNPKNIKTYIPEHPRKPLMKQAFAVWTKAMSGKIVFKYVNSPEQADITVKFVKNVAQTTGSESAIGLTYNNYYGNHMQSAEILISNKTPGGSLLKKDGVYRVMIHEIGHALGRFGHSEDRDSVMYSAKVNMNATLTPADIKYMNNLYGF